MILGAGPNRIGQGIEFDYCCVHAAMTVRETGRDAVMVNCNPETVSTDYDTSDRLYFEPLTLEHVLAVCEQEKPEGVIVQFGGQTPLKLAQGLQGRRDPAARHPGRGNRRGRGPRQVRCADRPPRNQAPALRQRHHQRGSRGDRRPGRLPAAGPPVFRTRWPGDGDLLLGGRPRGLPRRRPRGLSREAAAARPLPRERDRGRCRCALRRPRSLRRRNHAARRGSRRPLRRFGLRDPADEHRRRDARGNPRGDCRDRARTRRDRVDQHPVCDRRRRSLRN